MWISEIFGKAGVSSRIFFATLVLTTSKNKKLKVTDTNTGMMLMKTPEKPNQKVLGDIMHQI